MKIFLERIGCKLLSNQKTLSQEGVFEYAKWLCCFFIFCAPYAEAQNYLPGETYFGQNEFIEYKAGNLPIIISAPHGGILEPDSIPDRNCQGCVYVRDTNTEDLIRKMYEAIFEQFGCYPHVIINRLHRRKLDANRGIEDAADGNELAEIAWQDFHSFIELAQDSVAAQFGKGLYLDLHGHGHEIQRLELGYRLRTSILNQADSMLNSVDNINISSIRNLVNDNRQQHTLSELLRGANSFGQLYENENFPSVPSQADPYPMDSEPYFRGGYNTERHGSKTGSTIDGIQIECNWEGVRNTNAHRTAFAEATAKVLQRYLSTYYFEDAPFESLCRNSTASHDLPAPENLLVFIYPNPVHKHLHIECLGDKKVQAAQIHILNELGQIVYRSNRHNDFPKRISCSDFAEGFYFLRVKTANTINVRRFFKSNK